jgi:hypothetical protein
MHKLLLLFAATAIGLTRAHAAISVGPAGSSVISFNARPPAAEWSTKSLSGTELSFLSAMDLDAAVQTNSAGSINAQVVDAGAGNPPGQNALATWSSGGTTGLWTRPAGNGATLLMATLRNDTGADQTKLRLIYALGQSASTPAEQISEHEVYYSLSGDPGSWVNIPALSAGGIGTKSNTVALNGTWTNAAPLYVLWADDNTVGGVDRGYSLDDFFFACNTPPTLATIPDFIADVGRPVVLFAAGADADTSQDQLVYSLDLAPAAARINSSNGLFRWIPSRADAAATHPVTVRVTDGGVPLLNATRTFNVTVKDYVETSIGSAVVDVGQSTNVLLDCAATAPLTNLALTVLLPTDRLTNFALENLVSSFANAALDTTQAGKVSITFGALPGQTIAGTQHLARLHFTTPAGQSSSFNALQLTNIIAQRAQPGLAPTILKNDGRVVIVNGQPLLEAATSGAARTLTLYGRPGATYVIESSASPFGPWQFSTSVTLSNLYSTADASASSGASAIFFRARE